jgi:CHAT domain-containing protein
MVLVFAGCRSERGEELSYSQARTKLEQGYLDYALQSADRELRHENTPLWTWRFRLIRAEVLIRRGKADEASNLLRIEPPSLPADLLARRKILQAQILCQFKDFVGSTERLRESSDLANGDRALIAEVFFVRGKCEGAQNHPDLARQDYLRAEELANNASNFVQASAMGNLGVLLMQSGRYDEAIGEFQHVLELARRMQSPLLEQLASGNLGFCYVQLGDWKQAILFSEQAEGIAERIENKPNQERWLINLGKAHQALWELPDAEANYVKALSIARSLNDPTAAAACYNNLTRLSLSRHDIYSATRYLNEGVSLHVDGERLHFTFDEARIAAAQTRWADAAELLLDLTHETDTDPVLRSLAERDLGEVYWHQNRLALADQMFRQGIETAEAAMLRIKDIEHRMSFLDEERFYDSYIRFLASQNRTADALAVAERARAQVSAQDPPHKNSWTLPLASKFQSRLKAPYQIALAYWITDEESFLWAITPSKFQLFKLPGHLELHRLIDKYNAEIHGHNEISDSPAAEKLYQTLVRPAENLIPKDAHVVVIPSKVLCWVSFEALVIGEPRPHYWIEDVDVQISGSLARMPGLESRSQRADARHAKEVLVLGAPVEASSDFPTLKHAPEEIQRVQTHFAADRESIISGKDATPQAYAAAHPGDYRFIHLDTHGTSSDRSPLDSAIVLSPGADGSYKLYARDIKDIPLHAELVTISACYGAGTRWYNNEGVVGLGWAFLRAGARQVIASLWDVDDAYSPQLMDDFYGELTQGKSAAQALRDAKLKMLHTGFYRHPDYWASLQLYTGS